MPQLISKMTSMQNAKKIYTRLIIVLIILGSFVVIRPIIHGENIDSSVNVFDPSDNVAPSFVTPPFESVVSDETSPSNTGTTITFKATADDLNDNQYYLIICKSNTVTPHDNGVPTCNGSGQWCIGSLTNANAESSCSYSIVNSDTEINEWYAFVCDSVTSNAMCSAVNQGSGTNGSPFHVNHQPTVTGVTATSEAAAGENIIWTSQAFDQDAIAPIPDRVKLLICKTAGVEGLSCSGGASNTFCESSLVENNPTCTYTIPFGTKPKTYTSYIYVVDNHLQYTSAGNRNFDVKNTPPESSGELTVIPKTTPEDPTFINTNVAFSAKATDSNSDNIALIVCASHELTVTGNTFDCKDKQICKSGFVNSGQTATCTYEIEETDTSDQLIFAFMCDSAEKTSCVTVTIPDDSDTIYVHHPLNFSFDTSISKSVVLPGESISVTLNTNLYTNTIGESFDNTFKILVCKQKDLENNNCKQTVEGTWCKSELMKDPSCTISIPIPFESGIYPYYVYIIDQFGSEAAGKNQGFTSTFEVKNTVPTSTNVTVNQGSDIVVGDSGDSPYQIQVTIVDTNSCKNIKQVTAAFYRSDITSEGCDEISEQNENYCYNNIICNPVTSGNTCTGTEDSSADYICQVNLQSNADPTSSGPYKDLTWLTTIRAIDNNDALIFSSTTTGVEIQTNVGIKLSSINNYLQTNPTQLLNNSIELFSTGNTGIDFEIFYRQETKDPNQEIRFSANAPVTFSQGRIVSEIPVKIGVNLPKNSISSKFNTATLWLGFYNVTQKNIINIYAYKTPQEFW